MASGSMDRNGSASTASTPCCVTPAASSMARGQPPTARMRSRQGAHCADRSSPGSRASARDSAGAWPRVRRLLEAIDRLAGVGAFHAIERVGAFAARPSGACEVTSQVDRGDARCNSSNNAGRSGRCSALSTRSVPGVREGGDELGLGVPAGESCRPICSARRASDQRPRQVGQGDRRHVAGVVPRHPLDQLAGKATLADATRSGDGDDSSLPDASMASS